MAKYSNSPEFTTPQELANYYAQRDATKGMVLAKMKDQFGLSEEEALSYLSKAQLSQSIKTRGKGLTELLLGVGVIVAIVLITGIIVRVLWETGYVPGAPIWLGAGGVGLFGLILAFRGLMKMLSGTDTDGE